MSGIRVNEWLHNSGTGGIWQTSAGNVGIASSVPTTKLEITGDAKISGISTCAAFAPSQGQLANKNLIGNGAFNIAQRGTSSTTSGFYSVDRFSNYHSGTDEAPTQAQHALTSADTGPWEEGFRYSAHITNGNQTSGAGAADYIMWDTNVEAIDMATSGWNYTSTTSYVTLSFWVKSSVAQNFHGYIRTYDGTAMSMPFETGALTANTWKKVIKNIPGHANLQFDSNFDKGFKLRIHAYEGTDHTGTVTLDTWAAYSSSARTPDDTTTWYTTNDSTFAITGVQLEIGSTATGFEHRAYGDELQKCLRYFWTITGDNYDKPGISTFANSASTCRAQVKFPVPMRAAPSFTGSATAMMMDAADDSANFNINTFALNNVTTEASPSGCTLEVSTSSMTAGQAGDLEFKANSGFMQFSAEL